MTGSIRISEKNIPPQNYVIRIPQGQNSKYDRLAHKSRKINCGWYQKPTDTGTVLNFRSCAHLQYKRSVIEGTVHRVFRSTSTWEEYDKAMKINREQWLDNQYPES